MAGRMYNGSLAVISDIYYRGRRWLQVTGISRSKYTLNCSDQQVMGNINAREQLLPGLYWYNYVYSR